ncbi:uncharacterized protein [Aegilops tauschii subsp. strangulata]|nr:uncharacterized protein LOC120976425 [Aegilops tauschii subsp. strangulata]XP_044355381.1 uncharacterized protein LOC123077218 [Triticum aestivum]
MTISRRPAGRPSSPDGTAARLIWSRSRHTIITVVVIVSPTSIYRWKPSWESSTSISKTDRELLREGRRSPLIGSMSGDWGPVLIATAFFVVMLPGLICEIPGGGGRGRPEFHSMKTNGIAMFVHTVIFFAFCAIFMVAVGVHVYAG